MGDSGFPDFKGQKSCGSLREEVARGQQVRSNAAWSSNRGKGVAGHSDSREDEREAHLHRESRACTSSFADYQMSSKHISKGVILYNFKSSKGLANCCLMLTNLAVTSILVVKRVKDN